MFTAPPYRNFFLKNIFIFFSTKIRQEVKKVVGQSWFCTLFHENVSFSFELCWPTHDPLWVFRDLSCVHTAQLCQIFLWHFYFLKRWPPSRNNTDLYTQWRELIWDSMSGCERSFHTAHACVRSLHAKDNIAQSGPTFSSARTGLIILKFFSWFTLWFLSSTNIVSCFAYTLRLNTRNWQNFQLFLSTQYKNMEWL